VKKVCDFPVPREGLVSDIPAGDEKIANLFYSVGFNMSVGSPNCLLLTMCGAGSTKSSGAMK
jgi:hypothetical protein